MPHVLELDHPDRTGAVPATIRRAPGAATITLAGEIDVSRVLEAEKVIRAAERDHVDLVLDLRAVTLLDSSALNLVADTAHRARDRGGRVAVHVTHPLVRRVLRMMFFDEIVDVHPPLAQADDRDGPTVLPL